MSVRTTSVATIVAYAVLGTTLVATRFVGLGRSFWHDEIVTVRDFVQAGPREILAGAYIPNNHPLFSLLGWATAAVAGESEALLRLWSVIPFLVGVIVVTVWVHARVGAASGVLYLFFVSASPLLLDLSSQARGYGLAFLAMSVLIVAALEAETRGRTRELVAVVMAGTAGSLTLPNFAVAYIAVAIVLTANPNLRRRMFVTGGLSAVAIAAWYAPNAGEIVHGSRQDYGTELGALDAVIAPFQQILIPGLVALGGDTPVFEPAWLVLLLLVLVPMTATPLVRDPYALRILVSPVVVSIAALWLTRTSVVPRFVSFLLVPMLMLLATGVAAVLRRGQRPPLVRTVASVAVLGIALVGFSTNVTDIVRYPREAWRDAAAVVDLQRPRPTAVVAYALNADDLGFYSRLPIIEAANDAGAAACSYSTDVALVVNLWRRPAIEIPCMDRPGVRRHRLKQYARGSHIDVWLIPPASSSN